jgi:putative membrane protein
MLQASIEKNDKKAYWLIGIFSVVVFAAVSVLTKLKLNVDLGFDVHLFALFNAITNATIAVILVAALTVVKKGNYQLHKQLMIGALILSVLFLVSYIAHHLFAGEAKFGDSNHDGIVSDEEKTLVGGIRYVYYLILITHIFLAGIILPFILYTAYRALTGEFAIHKKVAKITWPLWLYVAITGPIVYWMIKPYYL